MKLDHKVREYKAQGKIFVYCEEKDKHHGTLCPKKFNQDKDQKKDTSALESNEDTESGMIAIGEKVIMQTALMTIKGSYSILTTRALFDTGSRRNYVTEEVAISFKLKPIEEQTFSIYAFGDSKPKQKTALIVELKIQTRFGKSIKIKATVPKQINGPLQRTPLQLKNKRMLKQQYELTDTSPSQMETYTLGILIGNDHYYDVMLDKREVVQEISMSWNQNWDGFFQEEQQSENRRMKIYYFCFQHRVTYHLNYIK